MIFLAGPTGSGKTAVAVSLAGRYPLELISVDAAQVYRGLNVGTAKPGKDLQARVPHGLIDVCEPSDAFSVADYCAGAKVLIGKTHARTFAWGYLYDPSSLYAVSNRLKWTPRVDDFILVEEMSLASDG